MIVKRQTYALRANGHKPPPEDGDPPEGDDVTVWRPDVAADRRSGPGQGTSVVGLVRNATCERASSTESIDGPASCTTL